MPVEHVRSVIKIEPALVEQKASAKNVVMYCEIGRGVMLGVGLGVTPPALQELAVDA